MFKLFKKKPEWVYGTCNNTLARKHRKKGNVQMLLWPAGQQGHKVDYWHNFGAGWETLFKEDETMNPYLKLESSDTVIK